MKLQVLVATINQTDHSLLEKMNIRSEAIIGNQCNYNKIEEFNFRGNKIKWLSFNERGVGLNRNNTLMRADGTVCLFADDDVVYYDDYVDIIEKAFENNPKADIIIFNVKEVRENQPMRDKVTRNRFIGRKGVAAYGAVTIAARTLKLKEKNIVFHRMFGGGAEFKCGEDTIFLTDCLKKGLKVYTCTDTIAKVYYNKSTWFDGYNDKFFIDKGVLYKHLYPRIAKILSIYHIIKHRERYAQYGLKRAVIFMLRGIKVK